MFVYLLLVLAICWLPLMARLQVNMSESIDEEAPRFVQQIPRISIHNGVVSTDAETPYYIKEPGSGKTAVIIDLTGETTSLEGTGAKILLTRNQLIARKSTMETRTYDLSGIKEFSVDRARIENWLRWFRKWFVVILFPLTLFFVYSFRVIQAFIYGLIGLIFTKILHAPLNYMASVRMAMIAITPVLILDTVFGFVKFHPPVWWLLGLVISMGYLFFGIKAAAAAPNPAEASSPLPGQP